MSYIFYSVPDAWKAGLHFVPLGPAACRQRRRVEWIFGRRLHDSGTIRASLKPSCSKPGTHDSHTSTHDMIHVTGTGDLLQTWHTQFTHLNSRYDTRYWNWSPAPSLAHTILTPQPTIWYTLLELETCSKPRTRLNPRYVTRYWNWRPAPSLAHTIHTPHPTIWYTLLELESCSKPGTHNSHTSTHDMIHVTETGVPLPAWHTQFTHLNPRYDTRYWNWSPAPSRNCWSDISKGEEETPSSSLAALCFIHMCALCVVRQSVNVFRVCTHVWTFIHISRCCKSTSPPLQKKKERT